MIYVGCGRHFCTNHLIDHTNELRNRFEEIINEYNIINEIFHDYKEKFKDSHTEIIHKQEKEFNQIRFEINENQKTSK